MPSRAREMPQERQRAPSPIPSSEGDCSRRSCPSRGGRRLSLEHACGHPHQLLRRRRRRGGVAIPATAQVQRPRTAIDRLQPRSCAWRRTRSSHVAGRCRTAAGRGGRRFRRRTITPTGTWERRRSAKAFWPPMRSRATPAICVPPGGGRLPARRRRTGRRRAALARLGRSERSPVRHAFHELRRRRGRDQRLPRQLTRSRRAAFPRRCARRHALAGRAGGGPTCPETACSWRWTDDPGPAGGPLRRRDGSGRRRARARRFADRTGDPTFRAYARAGAAGCDS